MCRKFSADDCWSFHKSFLHMVICHPFWLSQSCSNRKLHYALLLLTIFLAVFSHASLQYQHRLYFCFRLCFFLFWGVWERSEFYLALGTFHVSISTQTLNPLSLLNIHLYFQPCIQNLLNTIPFHTLTHRQTLPPAGHM